MLKAKIKGSIKSWTQRFNVAMGAVAIGIPQALSGFPQLKGYVPDQWYHYAIGTLVVGNFLLRFRTTTGLENK